MEVKGNMLKKIVALGLVGLFLVVSFAVAENSIGPYNPIADVNRDGTVDVLDLIEVGQAYGSTYSPITYPNKTTVTVLSYTSNFSYTPVANAVVGIRVFGTNMNPYCAVQWKFTNSSGIATFELAASSRYFAIAWSDDWTSYNYANFTTNSRGEASVTIWLNHLPSPSTEPHSVRAIPMDWTVILVLDNNTNLPYTYDGVYMSLYNLTLYHPDAFCAIKNYTHGWNFNFDTGIVAYHYSYDPWSFHGPNTDNIIKVCTQGAGCLCLATYHTDQYGGAYVVITIYRDW